MSLAVDQKKVGKLFVGKAISDNHTKGQITTFCSEFG